MNGKFVKTKDDSDELLRGATKNEVNSVSLCFNRGWHEKNFLFPSSWKNLGEKSSLGYGSLKTLKLWEMKEKMWAERGEVAHFHWYVSLIIFFSCCCCRRCCCYNRSHFDSKLTVVNNFPFKLQDKGALRLPLDCHKSILNSPSFLRLISNISAAYSPQCQLHKLGKIKGEISTHDWIYVCLLSIWGGQIEHRFMPISRKIINLPPDKWIYDLIKLQIY